jgi:hypothetical protein
LETWQINTKCSVADIDSIFCSGVLVGKKVLVVFILKNKYYKLC